MSKVQKNNAVRFYCKYTANNNVYVFLLWVCVEARTRNAQLPDITAVVATGSGRRTAMSRLDDAISQTAYILDCLMALRNIHDSGSCNDCVVRDVCERKPKPGQMVRYNCPFYEKEGAEK